MQKKYVPYLLLLLSTSFISAMVFDTARFLPLFKRPRAFFGDVHTSFAVDFMMSTASKSTGDNQQEIGLPEFHGIFDLKQLANGVELLGCPNLLRSDWRSVNEIKYRVEGKRQMQGLATYFYHYITDWLSTGGSWVFMRVNSGHEFFLDKTTLFLGPGDREELERTRQAILNEIGLCDGHTAQLGFGDIDWWLRFGCTWDHALKFRMVDVGVWAGVLIPTGVLREPDRPASIPFGGNGHWGVYGALDGLVEIKEDLFAGVYFQINKRFTRSTCLRVPVCTEPDIWGAAQVITPVNPGPTVIFNPYFVLNQLRPNLGIWLGYTLVAHMRDSITPCVLSDDISLKFDRIEEISKWNAEYAVINIYYDFQDMCTDLNPVVSLRWDVPTEFFVASRVNKAHMVSIGFELLF